MILTIPYSHVDIHQAYRLLKWIGWLSSVDGESMKREEILLVPSQSASRRTIHAKMCELAPKIFKTARTFTPEGEHEKGWPGACNFMLKAALEHVRKHFKDDIFLLEPDAIPLTPRWWAVINEEWQMAHMERNYAFMGAFVNYDIPHMTGIGVYGENALAVAPKLAEVQNERGWDTYAADQIVPNAHFTNLIQHVWWRLGRKKYADLSLEMVEEDAVIFHQDKEGKLFAMLDEFHFGGEADRAVGYSERFTEELVDMAYFKASNLSKSIDSLGLNFNSKFDPVDQIGGIWYGVYATEDEAEVVALRALAAKGGSIKELAQAQYEEIAKKKAPQRVNSNASPAYKGRVLEAKINQSPAVLVENPKSAEESPETPGATGLVDDISKVLIVAKVKPPETAPKRNQRRGKK